MVEPPPDEVAAAISTTGAPRWVKVFAIVAMIVVVLLVIALAGGGGGRHGPGRHLGGRTPTPTVAGRAVLQS